MVLDIKFIILGSLIILALIPLYIYRKEIYERFVRGGDLKSFLKDANIYLVENHPNIKFDFDIVEKLEKEEVDLKREEILIVENLVSQFAYFEYELTTQTSISKEKLWSSYDQNSVLRKDNKLPIDWSQRKEAVWSRENGKCNRCGIKTNPVDAQTLFVKQMRNGGGFNLENIVLLCNDCSRVIRSENVEKMKKDLKIYENLMKKVMN